MGYELAMKILVLCLLLGAAAAAGSMIRPSRTLRQVPAAIFVFGDSTMDVGNNNYLLGKNVPRANQPYHGIDMPGSGKPSGRFSNGYNTADFVGNNIPLSRQVQYFNATCSEMVSSKGSGAVTALLSRSIFLIGLGGNDLSAFANAAEHAPDSDVAAFYGNLISHYSTTITELYAMGARRFAIINVGLAGCLPVARVLDAAGACSERRNELAAGFNGALRSLLAGLAAAPSRMPGLAYSLADSYGIMEDIFADPPASGFADVASACCGGGRLGAAGCLPNSALCADRDGHYFWDGIHPSQRAAELRVEAFYDGPAQYTTPINFKQLVVASGTH
ncbi:unnamed protein product [Urochloa humidicola]